MKHSTLCSLLLISLLLSSFSFAQKNSIEDNSAEQTEQKQLQEEEYWPTKGMVEMGIRNMADQMREIYDLDDDQFDETQELLLKRIPKWLEKNEKQLKPLIRQMVQSREADRPPTPEDVAQWAKNARPMFDKFRDMMDHTTDDFAKLLNDDQKQKLKEERKKFQEGMQQASGWLKEMEDGKFDPDDWYKRKERRENYRKQQEEARREREQAKAALQDPITEELNLWEVHVQEFCSYYELEESQTEVAWNILKEMSERAESYRSKRKQDLDALEQKLINGDFPDEQAAEKALTELYGPIDRMFQELDERLHRIPTSTQRRKAELRNQPKDETISNKTNGQ